MLDFFISTPNQSRLPPNRCIIRHQVAARWATFQKNVCADAYGGPVAGDSALSCHRSLSSLSHTLVRFHLQTGTLFPALTQP
uniref:Uncharacterized protein K0122H06.37 n=1 Tax=Oryza sativa subsp. indica TaxID=39946 RepID=C8TFE9_ORYSI|nr:hypothetical protein [Oryza sativa Indica Group]